MVLVEIEFHIFFKLSQVYLLKILKVDKLILKIVDKNCVLKNCR